MKILHTSDWHLGKSIHGRKRYLEFQQFLDWMIELIKSEDPDALLIAGDIFDTITPTNEAQKLYYNFLVQVSLSQCRHVVITAGNHDSPTLLSAPRELLSHLNIHVVGSLPSSIEEEVLLLNDHSGQAGALVCAVPFLRDKDIRKAEADEGIEERNRKVQHGLVEHYRRVVSSAVKKREALGEDVPIIAMGHLFTKGGQGDMSDGVRDLYVGALGHVDAALFPDEIDYLALGHLHRPQKVKGFEVFRYSGSPLAFSFGESSHRKIVLSCEFTEGRVPKLRELAIPAFQELLRISGTLSEIEKQISDLQKTKSRAWLEVEYTGSELVVNLQETINSMVAQSELEVLLVKNKSRYDSLLLEGSMGESLSELDETAVFEQFLETAASDLVSDEKEKLKITYQKALVEMASEDINAE